MNANQEIVGERREGIDVVAMVRFMWRYRYLIGSISILFGLITVGLALTAKEIFRAEIVVTEVHDAGLSGSEGGLASQIGGLASMAGLNLPGAADATAEGVLASRHLIEELVRTQNLVPILTQNMKGKRATPWFATKRFQEDVVVIHQDPLKGLTTITVDWTDAATAAKWANEFVALANELIRAHDYEDATRNVDYLNKQITHTTEVEIQKALYNLIESETKKLMLANARTEYAFRIVDPAVPPEVRHSPRRTLWVLSGTALGFFVGTFIAFGYDVFRKRRSIQ